MTTFDYNRPLATANRLIAKYGQSGFVRRPGAKTGGSAANPTFGPPIKDPARFVITSYSAKDIDGSRILAKDKKALIASGTLPSDPSMTDLLVEADGTAWKIVAVDTLRPAETTLLHTVQVRR